MCIWYNFNKPKKSSNSEAPSDTVLQFIIWKMNKRRRSSEDDNVVEDNENLRMKRRFSNIRTYFSIMHPDVIPLIGLCLRPEDESSMNLLLQQFWDKTKGCFLQKNEESVAIFCKFAIASVYLQNRTEDSVISRILYAYIKKARFCSEVDLTDLEDNNSVRITDEDSFLTCVESFNLNLKEWNIRVLCHIMFRIVQNGQLGFLHLLIKYDLVPFLPVENPKMIKHLTRTLL